MLYWFLLLLILYFWFYTIQKAMPIELNARIGGAETFTNVFHAWGVNLARAALRIALGLSPSLPFEPSPQSRSDSPDREMPSVISDAIPLNVTEKFSYALPPTQCQPESRGILTSDIISVLDRCACGCPSTCCSGGRCFHWDFLLTRNQVTSLTSVASPLSIGGLSEPDPAFWKPCLPSKKVRDQAVCTLVASDGWGHSCAALPPSQMSEEDDRTSDAGSMQCPSKTSVNLKCCPAIPLKESTLQHKLHRIDNRATLLNDDFDPSKAPSSWSSSSIHDMQPKSFVHSVNFLPDWSGWGVIKRIELLPDAKLLSGFVDIELNCKHGDLVAFPPAGFSPMGWIVSKSQVDAEDAAKNMDRILENLIIEIDNIK